MENEKDNVVRFPFKLHAVKTETPETAPSAATQSISPPPEPNLSHPEIAAALKTAEDVKGPVGHSSLSMMRFQNAALANDFTPENIEEICKNEPWKKGLASAFSLASFGFVPEKLLIAARRYPEGSPEFETLKTASNKANEIYWEQLEGDMARLFTSLRTPERPLKVVEEECRIISRALQAQQKAIKDHPEWTLQAGRLKGAAFALDSARTEAKRTENRARLAAKRSAEGSAAPVSSTPPEPPDL